MFFSEIFRLSIVALCSLETLHPSFFHLLLQEDDDTADEYDEVDEDDRYKFADQLCCIGALGRLVPNHTVPLLSK